METQSRFVGWAEESGLIIAIGDWALTKACPQGQCWSNLKSGPITMAVNISALHFNRGILLQTVNADLDKTKFSPQLLDLELTESTLLHDMVEHWWYSRT